MTTQILDTSELQSIETDLPKGQFMPWYQITECVWFLIIVSFTVIKIYIPIPAILLCFGFILFNFATLFFEHKDKVITKLGVFGRIIIRIISSILVIGLLFEMNLWPYKREMLTVGLLTINYQYVVYPLFLKKVRPMFKGLLALSAFLIPAAPIGVLFKIMSWPNSESMIQIGAASLIVSILIMIVLLFQKPNIRERYQTIFYLGRYLLLIMVTSLVMTGIYSPSKAIHIPSSTIENQTIPNYN